MHSHSLMHAVCVSLSELPEAKTRCRSTCLGVWGFKQMSTLERVPNNAVVSLIKAIGGYRVVWGSVGFLLACLCSATSWAAFLLDFLCRTKAWRFRVLLAQLYKCSYNPLISPLSTLIGL